MPTTRIPILDVPVSRPKAGSPTRAQAEAVQTYKEKAEQARKRNNSVGIRVPDNIASYDYAHASSPRPDAAIPAVLKPSNSPPALGGAFPTSPAAAQRKWTPEREPVVPKSKISSNTSVFRKPTVLGVTTSAAVLEESVAYVRADAKTGARSPATPPRSTTVKISLKPKTPSPVSAKAAGKAPARSPDEEQSCAQGTRQHACPVEHCRGTYYRAPYVETEDTTTEAHRRSPSPTKTMPNFTRQYSLEGDSIFGYKVKNPDPLGTVAGADKSASNSDEEKPKPPSANKRLEELRKAQARSKGSEQKRTLADRWPWIRREAGSAMGKPSGEPPKARAPDPPVRPPGKLVKNRPVGTYVSPFEDIETPPATPPHAAPVLVKPAATAKAAAGQAEAAKKSAPRAKSIPSPCPEAGRGVEAGLKQIQDLAVLGVKIGLALYMVVALWFVLDALREALCVMCVPLQYVLLFVWAVVSSAGRVVGGVAGSVGGKVRVLGR